MEDIEHRCTLQVSIHSIGARRLRALSQRRRAHSGYLCTLAALHLFCFKFEKVLRRVFHYLFTSLPLYFFTSLPLYLFTSLPLFLFFSFFLSVQGRYSLKVSISPCNFVCIYEDGVFCCVWVSARGTPQKCHVCHAMSVTNPMAQQKIKYKSGGETMCVSEDVLGWRRKMFCVACGWALVCTLSETVLTHFGLSFLLLSRYRALSCFLSCSLTLAWWCVAGCV